MLDQCYFKNILGRVHIPMNDLKEISQFSSGKQVYIYFQICFCQGDIVKIDPTHMTTLT